MNRGDSSQQDFLSHLLTFFEEGIPFNKLLELKASLSNEGEIVVRVEMKDNLIGNTVKNILHGGVISSVLDVTGGMVAMAEVVQKMAGRSADEISKRLFNVGTIDLRIDYLRPGRGNFFLATGSIMRTGQKVAVVRMQLHNDENLLIAAGTGTYIIG